MKEKIKEFYNKDICRYLIIFLVSLILCIPMFNDKLNIYSDDGIQHIARAMGTEVSLKEGSLFGNVIDDFANKFGYSWNLFYGSFTTYGIIFFKLGNDRCLSIPSSTKSFIPFSLLVFENILSSSCFFLWYDNFFSK